MDINDKSSKLIVQDCNNDKENESIPMDQVFCVYIFFACLHEALKHQQIEKMKKIEDNEEKHVPIQKPVSSERSAQVCNPDLDQFLIYLKNPFRSIKGLLNFTIFPHYFTDHRNSFKRRREWQRKKTTNQKC